jgi:hypothetical protein
MTQYWDFSMGGSLSSHNISSELMSSVFAKKEFMHYLHTSTCIRSGRRGVRVTSSTSFGFIISSAQFSLAPEVDYVFFHMGAIYNILAFPFFLIRKSFNTKFYWWKAHGHINWVGRLALRCVDRVYTSTESGFPIATKKRVVVGQAIDTTLFTLDKVFLMMERMRKMKSSFVGRITPIKRIEDLHSDCGNPS